MLAAEPFVFVSDQKTFSIQNFSSFPQRRPAEPRGGGTQRWSRMPFRRELVRHSIPFAYDTRARSYAAGET